MAHNSMPSRVSISNIAWPDDCDEEAVALAQQLGFKGIDLAPGKIFSNVSALAEARNYRAKLEDQGLSIPGFQSIVFSVEDCALFGNSAQQQRLKSHLAKVAELAGAAGAGACVFGSPALRNPGSLSPTEAFDTAVEFFRDVAPNFEAAGSALAFEANAAHYDCKFITHTAEAIAFVREVDHTGLRLQIDTGTIALSKEPLSVIGEAEPLAVHFHASEPDLVPLGTAGTNHAQIGQELAATDYRGWRCVEMRCSADWREAMKAAATVMAEAYS